MSIANELTKLRKNLSSAYDALSCKGAVMPEEKTMHNLSAAIGTIATGTHDRMVGAFEYDDKGNIIKVCDEGLAYNVSIRELNLPEVTEIGDSAFMEMMWLSSAVIPKVMSITGSSFSACRNLVEVIAPEVSSVGECAFFVCNGLTGIPFDKLVEVGSQSFMYSGVKSVHLQNLRTVGDNAFYGCEQLEDVCLPNAVDVDVCGFCDCCRLSSVALPSAQNIGENCFGGYSQLKVINLSSGISPYTAVDTASPNYIGNKADYWGLYDLENDVSVICKDGTYVVEAG